MRIGILTGGGDVPGLNPCIKAVVNRVVHDGHEVVGLRRGWAALLHHDPGDPASAAEWFQPLTAATVRTIDRTGGTFLHTSRTNPGGREKVRRYQSASSGWSVRPTPESGASGENGTRMSPSQRVGTAVTSAAVNACSQVPLRLR